ncbi:hypothetical protein AB0395_01505 [Streptosporangium sp. NPDC051023]|uniref:WXG100-like domain-containing protein n=1 Tax=Streptosporangium sp. NPDC051023 TaxID=3155410 RepID=UPI00344CC37D
MALDLPEGLAGLLYDLGYLWLQANEDHIHTLSGEWTAFGFDIDALAERAAALVRRLLEHNDGAAIAGFTAEWTHQDAPHAVAVDGAHGAQVLAACLAVCAVLVLALKIVVTVQLTVLLTQIVQALRAAPLTGNLSLLKIPAYKQVADRLLNLSFSQAARVLLA